MKHLTIGLAVLFVAWVSLPPAVEAGDYSYVGSKNCMKCHLKEFRSWRETKMAKAFDLLKPGERADAKRKAGLDPAKDYTADAECVACHVTGLGKPGGFVSAAETPELLGVACEACHGAGSEYTKDQHMSLKNKEYKLAQVVEVGLVSPVSEAMCVNCHNEKSPFYQTFDFKTMKDQGAHEMFPLKYKHD